MDVLLPGFGSAPIFVVNDGQGAFTEGPSLDWELSFVLTAELVDVDNDGYIDLLVGSHEDGGTATSVLWGDSTGTYGLANATVLPIIAGNGVIQDIDAGDIDGDGDKDLVVTRTSDGTGAPGFHQGYYLQVLVQAGPRRFNDVTIGAQTDHQDPEASSIRWVRLYDIDGDGDLDIVADEYEWRDLVWKNDGSGWFVGERMP